MTMRLANLKNRLVLINDAGAVDVERASNGLFASDPQAIYDRWVEFTVWAAQERSNDQAEDFFARDLGPAVPRPSQVFAVGLNYAEHADESGFKLPTDPIVFTKYVSSFAGPDVEVTLAGDRIDWEAELVVVIGEGGRDIAETDAWSHVAGLTVGQDLSDRDIQFWGHPPQFGLGKSARGFSPIGPWVTTVDEVASRHDPEALGVRCILREADGTQRVLQDGNTRDLIFPVRALIARLSTVVELLPGDVIFTGTPAGVGVGRDPQEFLHGGQELRTEIDGLGAITQRFVV